MAKKALGIYDKDLKTRLEHANKAMNPFKQVADQLRIQQQMMNPFKQVADQLKIQQQTMSPFKQLADQLRNQQQAMNPFKQFAEQLNNDIAKNIRESINSNNTDFAKALQDLTSSRNHIASIVPELNSDESLTVTISDSILTNLNIQMRHFNILATDVDETDLDDNIDLTEDEFQEVRDAIICAADGMAVKLDGFLNNLMEYALKSAPNIKAFVLGIIKAIITAYIVTIISTYYPPATTLEMLHMSRTEVLQQSSQNTINKYSHEELNKYRLVRVTGLNVRSKPSIDTPIITGLSLGAEVKIIKKNDEWVLIQWSDKDEVQIKGWVKERYLTEPQINEQVE